MLMRSGGRDGEEVLPGSGGGNVQQKMMFCGGCSLLLQQVLFRGSSGSLQQMLPGCRGGLLLEQMLLRCGMGAELKGRGIVIRLGRLWRLRRFGRFRRLGDGDTHYSTQAQHDRCERKKDGETAVPLHGTTYVIA